MAVAMAAASGAGVSLERAYPVFLDISEAAKLAEDAALPLQAALRRHELSLEERAGARKRARAQSADQGEGGRSSLGHPGGGRRRRRAHPHRGRRGLGRINRLRLGSVSANVLRPATGPVLIVPAPDSASGGATEVYVGYQPEK